MTRGEVWWVEDPAAGARPHVVLTRDTAIAVIHSVIVAPATRTSRGIPTEVHLGVADGMPDECVVSITVRMSEDRVQAIDELVASGRASRAAVIVEAIDRLVADLERERIDREIVEGYRRVPETDEELAWAKSSGLRSIADEPW